MNNNIRDIIICILIIGSIHISNKFFPHNIIMDIIIYGLAIYYFGGKLIKYLHK